MINKPDGWEVSKDWQRYKDACHAMQTGVKYDNGQTPEEAWSLRVGVNVAMTDLASLATLLVEKGVIGWDEYAKALADGAEREMRRYEGILSERFGKPVKLR